MSSPPPPSNTHSSSPPPSSPPPPPPNSSSPPPPSQSPPPPPKDSSPPPPSNGNQSPSPPPPPNSPPPPPSDNNGDSSNSPHAPPPPPPPPPPPSHSHAIAPPSHKRSSPPANSSSSSTNVPLIAGVTAGAVLLLVVMILFIVVCAKKKKKNRKHHDQMNYYRDHSNGSKFSAYYSGPQQNQQHYGNWQTNGAPTTDNVARISSQQEGFMAGAPHSGVLSSGEMSSEYSGQHGPIRPPPPPSFALGFTKSMFTYDELAAATGGFSNMNMVGQGGYGYVYKGILPSGKEIAVKCLKAGSGQGDREFQAEVEIISRVHHRHLVSLVGYCIGESQRILVYEFLPNMTLEYHLHQKGIQTMPWATRLRIALGSAKGLAYLHEDCHPKIIHRDIKASNILLDFTYEAKVSDFGLAKLTTDNHTHVSTRVMGTFGYLAPEYASSGKLTEKSDVFSFGVMLLELITGKRPVDSDIDDSLVDWARPLIMTALEEGQYMGLVDPRLEGNYDSHEMTRMVACAGACIRHSSKRRPKMSQIVRAIEGDVSLDDLHELAKQSNSTTFGGSTEFDSGSYGGGPRGLMKKGTDSQDQEATSSEYGATGEYAHSHSSFSSNNSGESVKSAREQARKT